MSINTNVKELFLEANGRIGTDDELATLIQSLNEFNGIGNSTVTSKTGKLALFILLFCNLNVKVYDLD